MKGRRGNAANGLVYVEGGTGALDLITPLWEELRQYHQSISEHFSSDIAEFTFAVRKAKLLEKAEEGLIRVELVQTEAGEAVGYCVSSVDSEHVGEIDSISVRPRFRNQGIGHTLMRRAITWMDAQQVRSKVLVVLAGNDRVLPFYQRYGFFPRSIKLKQKADSDSPAEHAD